ncbi:MAG: S-layer homology domain-containing protein [Cyanobacteria bacterium P01_D01_bin.71]
MFGFGQISSKTTALAALGVIAGVAAPLVSMAPVAAQSQFVDVGVNYWARPYIETLAAQDIIAGFPDGTFKPDQPVTRAQFAAIVRQAFDQAQLRAAPRFGDVSSSYWASDAIADAYGQGFMSGYPDNSFKPEQQIPRVQVVVALANGLSISPADGSSQALSVYSDASQIPDYAQSPVAAATENAMVVSYPDVNRLRPQQTATRADVAAFIYQALVAQGQLPELAVSESARNYIVGYDTDNPVAPQTFAGTIPAGTQIPLRYPNASDVEIVVAPGQTVATALEVSGNLVNGANQVLIPAGSMVQGRIEPVEIRGASVTAAQFVADTLTINERTYNINAESSAIAATESVSAGSLENALITGAAESIIGSILGNGDLGSLVGAVIGGNGNVTSQNAVIVIDPTELDLTVDSDFTVGN